VKDEPIIIDNKDKSGGDSVKIKIDGKSETTNERKQSVDG
jgi:hypothetical protein